MDEENKKNEVNEAYTKKNILEKRVTSYFAYAMFFVMITTQCYFLKPGFRVLYLFMASLALAALVYESTFIGCTANNCTLDRNRKTVSQYQESFACQEANRVNWRRSYLIAFIPFVLLNCITPFETNVLTFILTLFILYFYFNFDSYHRSYLACSMEKIEKIEKNEK